MNSASPNTLSLRSITARWSNRCYVAVSPPCPLTKWDPTKLESDAFSVSNAIYPAPILQRKTMVEKVLGINRTSINLLRRISVGASSLAFSGEHREPTSAHGGCCRCEGELGAFHSGATVAPVTARRRYQVAAGKAPWQPLGIIENRCQVSEFVSD